MCYQVRKWVVGVVSWICGVCRATHGKLIPVVFFYSQCFVILLCCFQVTSYCSNVQTLGIPSHDWPWVLVLIMWPLLCKTHMGCWNCWKVREMVLRWYMFLHDCTSRSSNQFPVPSYEMILFLNRCRDRSIEFVWFCICIFCFQQPL